MKVEKLFKALACKWRIEILKQIAEQDVCICELEALNHIDKTTTIETHIAFRKRGNCGVEKRRTEEEGDSERSSRDGAHRTGRADSGKN